MLATFNEFFSSTALLNFYWFLSFRCNFVLLNLSYSTSSSCIARLCFYVYAEICRNCVNINKIRLVSTAANKQSVSS